MFVYFYFVVAYLILPIKSKVLFLEEFSDKRFKLRWFSSIENLDKQGNLEIGYGAITVDQTDGQGLKTEEDYRYYLISRKMKRKYSNKNKTLIIQYQVMFPALMECGGAYIKILGYDFEPTTFNSKTQYKIMFGPDVCGFAFENRELKVILNYKGKYYTINQIIRYHISHIPQLFTLIIRPDNTYEVHVNMSIVAKGHIGKDFRMLRPKMIRDKKAKTPLNWENCEFIIDTDVKPPPYLAQYPIIVDPEYYKNSTKYESSYKNKYISNPEFMKPWHPPFIRNNKFKGKWIPPLIENPNYNINDDFYLQSNLGGVGIDVWQMSSGVIYDNILITDNEKFARKYAKEKWLHVIEAIGDAERKSRPYNETMDYHNARYNNQDNEHHEHIDDTGKMACYHSIEALKNTILGPTKEQLNKIMDQRKNRIKRMKKELFSQLSELPKYSFFNPLYFNNIKREIEDYSLVKRLQIIHSRKFTDTVKFVNENNLNNF